MVRISRARFDPSRDEEAARLLIESQETLEAAIRGLPGLVSYSAAVDRAGGRMVNVSRWDTAGHADAIGALPGMRALRDVFVAAGVDVEPVVNLEGLRGI